MADGDAALARFFSGPPLTLVTAWRHRFDGYSTPHAHESIEIVWHLRGRGVIVDADGTTPFAEGGVTIHPPLSLHDQRMTVAGEDLCVHLRATRALPVPLRRLMTLPPLRDVWLRRELEALAAAPKARGAIASRALSLRGTAVLAALLESVPREEPSADSDPDGAMAAARGFLAERYQQEIAVADVARHVGLSGDHLRHRFTRAHGKGIVAWLHDLRVARAKELLAHSPLPLADIARLCGFGTDRYFSEIFRRAAGMTPGEFRRNARRG
jgi:AraC-like DNA-binding protein